MASELEQGFSQANGKTQAPSTEVWSLESGDPFYWGHLSFSLTWWTSTKHWLQFEWLFLLQEAHLNLLGWVRCPPLAPPPLCWVLLYRHCRPHLPESSMRAEKRLPHLCGPSAPPGTEQRHALWEGAKRPTCLHPPLSRPQSEC